jgi:cellulose synthase/poly-beta-1,6-N-acetylglucosamine synthase-like glycosyltransferase
VSDLLPVIVRDWHLLPPIGVVGALSRSIWLIRKVMSARYRPTINDFRTTSVVVPSFREDPDVLERCLGAWLAQRPTEVLVVLDVEDTEVFARLAARGDDRLTVISFRTNTSGRRWVSASARQRTRCSRSATRTPCGGRAGSASCRCRSPTPPSAR